MATAIEFKDARLTEGALTARQEMQFAVGWFCFACALYDEKKQAVAKSTLRKKMSTTLLFVFIQYLKKY